MTAPVVRTTCPYCGVGCGVLVRRKADGAYDVAGDPEHPANKGRLCSKGSALAETLSLDSRMLHPMIADRLVSWTQAINHVADRFKSTIAEHGADAVAFYVSGQLLTEDYYVANKLMKGFIGSANIDTNSRLCMASSVAGHKRAFGADTVPGNYDDLELADLVVLVGSNLAWCHPVLFQRIVAAQQARGTQIVVIDPRRTATAETADLHLALAPGSDVALFNGLLRHLDAAGAIDPAYVTAYTSGLDAALDAARADDPATVERRTGIEASKLLAFYELFTKHQRVVTVYSQGVNQSTAGTDKVNAIINCHLATGRIGKPGMGPFSITGQPNAMGGREVGGLANMLAAHMDLNRPDHARIVQRFWKAPTIATRPGYKAVDLFRAVGEGRIKALWIMATNPVDSLPEADSVSRALQACPFVVVSDVERHTDTTAYADVLLPSLAWGEKDGTVTNSERSISRQRAFMPVPGQAMPDWWQMAEVAKRMGFAKGFGFKQPAEIFAEHAALSATDNAGTRDFDIGAHAGITAARYDTLTPFQWPQPDGHAVGTARMFSDGRYFTADQRARFVPTVWREAASAISDAYPLVLNTGRIRDQWHTMTRTSKTARLMGHIAEPFVEMNPADAARAHVQATEIAVVRSAHGSILVRVQTTERQRLGSVFVPIHWTDQLSSSARVDVLVTGNTDPLSGQPELKFTPVTVEPFQAAWYGFAIGVRPPNRVGLEYWALAKARSGFRLECAGRTQQSDWAEFARRVLGIEAAADMLAYRDATTGQHRFAVFENECLIAALYVANRPAVVSRGWLADQLGQRFPGPHDRMRLLAGRAGDGVPDKGAIVCSCFDIGATQIATAVTGGGCVDVAGIGAALGAGTNCGSCRSEIGRIVEHTRRATVE